MSDDVPSNPDRPLVIVEWEDSQATTSGWRHETDLNPKYELPIVYTVGYLLQETERYVTVVQSMIFYKDVSNQICGIMSIPRSCIKSIKKLRRGGDYVPVGH